MERKSMSKIIIFTLDGEASPIFLLHWEIWVTALWSQIDWNSYGVFDPSTHTRYQARRQNLAAAGGGKNQKRGSHFKNTVLDLCSNWWAKCEMGEPGITGPPRWWRPCSLQNFKRVR